MRTSHMGACLHSHAMSLAACRDDPEFKKAMGDLQFCDLNGMHISFSPNATGRPSRRALMIHAARALDHCKDMYPDDFVHDLHNFWLESESHAQYLVER